MADSVSKRIQDLEISVKKFQLGVKDVVENGEKAKKTYKELLEDFNKLTATAERLVTASKNSFAQPSTTSKQYLNFLTKINTGLNNISSSYNKLDKAEKKTLSRRQEIQKKWDDRRFQRTLARLKKEQANRIAAEKKVQQRREAVQKQWDERKRTRENLARKKRNAKRVADEKKVQKQLEAEEKKKDFRGGFRGQLTPRAIGGALGSLTKYLGLYQAINAAQRVFRELTLGSVREAIAFEKALANLGAVAGATSEEVSKLGKNALSVAGSTKFTAQEIVGLQTELSKLGFSAEDVVASTQSIAFAAQALGSPLDATAALVGKLRNQFGLLVEETTTISDVLVTSINESALSFDGFGTAMQYVGPIAKNLGLSLEQTAGAMAVLADNGFTASRVGTGLRGIFTELGKTSADVEKSLKDLAEQNISLSEAVDLVGKRNAAQLITLLKNIDAIDEANDKYYQQGRALISAAKQADTLSGQMDILTSNFREFQINLGNAVVDSNIFIRVLGFLSEKAEQTALGFKFLREVGLQDFQKDIKESIDEGINPLTISLERMIESGKITTDNLERVKRAFREAAEESDRLGVSIQPSAEALEELGITPEQFSMLEGYFNLLEDGIERQKEQTAITKGQTDATTNYGAEVDALVDSSLKGNNVNKEAGILFKNLGANISSYEAKLKSANGVTEEQRIEYQAAINVLKGYQDQVTNTVLNEDELLKLRKKKRDKAIKLEKENVKERIKIENEATAELVNSINERAKQQTAIAEGAAEKADIEAKRQAAVSDAYKETAKTIAGIVPVYEENVNVVEDAVKANEKLSEVLGSEVINDVSKAFDDYSSQLKDLKKAQEDGTISQEGYERGVAELRNSFVETIETFRAFAGTSQEVNKFLDNMLVNFDALSISISNSTEKGKKDWDDFTKEFKETAWADIAKEAVDALGESLGAFNDVALENTKNRLAQDMEEVKNRYEVEDEILKSQLNNQLITESQFRKKQKDLRKIQVAEENAIAKELFNAEKKQDRNDAALDGVEAAAQSYLQAFQNYEPVTAAIVGSIGAGIALAQSTAQIGAINSRKYFDKKFADGGVVNGPSHAEGGVPFSVQGRGGYEMEGGEYIINKRATSMHRDLLDKINNTGLNASRNKQTKFAIGGIVGAVTGMASVDYLEEIAMNTAMSANNSSKPVRAYVADKDLNSNNTERKIRDRNDRI